MPEQHPAHGDSSQTLEQLQQIIGLMVADDLARGQPDHALDWLRAVLDNSPLPVFVKEAAGPVLLANRSQAEVWGMRPSELEGRDDQDLVALGMHNTEQAERYSDIERTILASGETVCSPPIMVSKGRLSGRRYRTLKAIMRVDGRNRILGISFPVDCSAADDQDIVSCLVDWIGHHPLAACLQDADDRFVALNQDLSEIFADSPEKLVGRAPWHPACRDHITVQSLLVFTAQNALVRACGQAYATPGFEMEGRDRARWTVQTLKVPLKGQNGSSYVFSIAIEPRDRRRLLSEITANEEMLRTVFSSCPNPLFVKDHAGRFVMVNPAMAELHNLTPEEMEGMDEWDLRAITGIPEAMVRNILSEDHQVIQSQLPLVLDDVAIPTANDLTHYHHTIKTPISLHGEPGYVLCVSTDVTETQRIKADLERKTAQLEQLVAAIRRLSGTLDPQEVLERTAREAKAVVGSDNAVILRLDATDQVLIPVVTHDLTYSGLILRDRIPLNDSLTGKAIAARKGLLFNHPSQAPGAHTVPGTPDQANERLMAIPLIAEGTVLGAMCLQRDGDPFSQENLSMAEAFAAYAASALRDAMAHEQLQQEVITRRVAQEELAATLGRQEQLIRAAQQLTTSIELDRVLERIVRQAREISDSDAAAILQLEADGHTLTPIVAVDETYATELLSTSTTIDASVTGAAIKAGRAVILNDLQSSMPRYHVPGTSAADDSRVIAAPLITEDRVIGALCLNRKGRPYSQQELQLVEAFAAYATAILCNARHHQQLHDTQAALAQERDQSQRYLDIAGVILMTLDASLRVTMINRTGCQILGREEAEIIGKDWPTLAVAPELQAKVRTTLQSVLRGQSGPDSEREYRIIAKDGREHYVVWHNAAIIDGEGEITGILSSGSDISALQAKSLHQQQLLETAKTLNQSLDLERVLHDIGESARNLLEAHGCAIYRLESDNVTLTPLISIETPHEKQIMATALHIDESFTGQGIKAGHGLIFNDPREQGGKQIPGTPEEENERVIVAPFVAEGSTLGAMCLNRLGRNFDPDDLALAETFATFAANAMRNAQRHQRLADARASLAVSEARYRTVVESIRDVIFVCDLDGIITYMSPVIERVTGHSANEWLGTPLCDWALPDERQGLERHLQDIISGKEQTHTFGMLRKDGSQAILSCSCRLLLGHENQPATISGLLGDITERTRLEARLRQSQKMETVGRLAGGVAHDFNNLLTVINGFSEMLLSTMPADDRNRGDIEKINAAGVRAADLVRRLLAFSRQQPVESTVVDVNNVVLGLSGMLPRMIGEHVEIHLEAGATPSSVYAGHSELEQILINLAANARDAIAETPQGSGHIEIRTSNCDLPDGYVPDYLGAQAGANVCLEVKDTGSGMDERTRGRIFEPFFTTKEVDKGTGLGLAIVYGLVEEMGGCIDVETAAGQGTCFRIYLPLTLEEPAPSPEARPVPSLSGQGVIMVIEDQEQVRRFACQMLRHMGYSVIACASSREALARLAVDSDHPPDLLLVDVIMPGQSGPELVCEIREAWPEMRALYMSGYPRNAVPAEVQRTQRDDLLRKPFTLAELGEAVQRALGE